MDLEYKDYDMFIGNYSFVYQQIYQFKEYSDRYKGSINIFTRYKMKRMKKFMERFLHELSSMRFIPYPILDSFKHLIKLDREFFPFKLREEDGFDIIEMNIKDVILDNKRVIPEYLKDKIFKITFDNNRYGYVRIYTYLKDSYYKMNLEKNDGSIFPDNNLNTLLYDIVKDILMITTYAYINDDDEILYNIFNFTSN